MRKLKNFRIIFKVISRNLIITAAALFGCAIASFFFKEKSGPFLIPALAAMITGGTLFMVSKSKQNTEAHFNPKDAYLVVTISWLLISLFGCLPYIFSGSIPSFINAFFESISGFSTTGASVLTDIEALPKSILFWRSMTHWIGGIGIIMLVILVMPSLHINGYHLFTLESSFQDKIEPKIKTVGIRILLIYISLTIAEIILLLLGGMNLFESICHSFATVATGGFSPKNSSIAGYSPYIQYVIMLFMLLSGINYVIYYYMVKKSFGKVRLNEELRFYLLMIFIVGLFVSTSLYIKMNKPLEESLRSGFFQVISIITCTGFATADYMQWPQVAWWIIFLSMFLGGSTGSTAGGIKMARHLVAIKNIHRSFRQMVHPKAVFNIQINNNAIDEETNSSILAFIVLYFVVFLAGSGLLMVIGIEMMTAGSSVATCMAGIGPGLGSVGPAGNFAHLPGFGKLVLSGFMLLGRLEIYTILMLFTREFWKK
jgi:trk system potassium uptake protein TrkH